MCVSMNSTLIGFVLTGSDDQSPCTSSSLLRLPFSSPGSILSHLNSAHGTFQIAFLVKVTHILDFKFNLSSNLVGMQVCVCESVSVADMFEPNQSPCCLHKMSSIVLHGSNEDNVVRGFLYSCLCTFTSHQSVLFDLRFTDSQ